MKTATALPFVTLPQRVIEYPDSKHWIAWKKL